MSFFFKNPNHVMEALFFPGAKVSVICSVSGTYGNILSIRFVYGREYEICHE